jgi:probable rRNA maturation factor
MLNRQHRGIDRTTDVLSFPQTSGPIRCGSRNINEASVLGDIVINLHKTDRQAKEYGTTFNEELKRLLIHGLVHLLGYDHETGGPQEKRMLAKEKELAEAIS